MFVAFHPLLNAVKEVFFDNNRQFIGDTDRTVVIFTQVFPVFQYGSETGNSEGLSRSSQQSTAVQGIDNILHQLSAVISPEDFLYDRGCAWIDFKHSIRTCPISQCDLTAVVLSLQCVFHLSALDLFRQFC